MTEIDQLAQAYACAERGNWSATCAHAVLDVAESLRKLVKQGEPKPVGMRVTDEARHPKGAAPFVVPNLAHPSCRSAGWRDKDGDEWRYLHDSWSARVRGNWILWGISDVTETVKFGPFTRIVD